MKMIVHCTNNVWTIDLDLCNVEHTVDRMIVSHKERENEKLVIFSDSVEAIETIETQDSDEEISWGTSD